MRLVRFALANPSRSTNLVAAIVAYDTARIALLRAIGGISAARLLAGDTRTEGDRP